MNVRDRFGSQVTARRLAWPVAVLVGLFASVASRGQSVPPDITFTKDIAPILQRGCQHCHHRGGVAPMSLVTYEEVRPWARSIKERTTIGPHSGVMPPWFVEKNIGIQKFKGDPSLADEEIAAIVKWVNNGAPRGNPGDMPKALVFDDSGNWTIGEPDLVVKSKEITVPASGPDQWGDFRTDSNRPHERQVRAVPRNQRGQRRPERRPDQNGWRAFRVPPHDVYQHRTR